MPSTRSDGQHQQVFSEERPRWGLEQHIWWVGPGKADAHYVAVERNCEPNMAAAEAFYMTIALAVALGIAMNLSQPQWGQLVYCS